MSSAWRLVIVAIGVLGAQACGGGGGNSAVGKCQNLQTTVCTRVADCAVSAGLITQAQRQMQYNSCVTQVSATLMCSKAVGVGPTYAQCIADLNATSCAVVNDPNSTLPPNCTQVILEPAP